MNTAERNVVKPELSGVTVNPYFLRLKTNFYKFFHGVFVLYTFGELFKGKGQDFSKICQADFSVARTDVNHHRETNKQKKTMSEHQGHHGDVNISM